MTSFVALYYRQTVADAKLIAVSADTSIVADVSSKLLKKDSDERDQILNSLEKGRRSAIELILKEAQNGGKNG